MGLFCVQGILWKLSKANWPKNCLSLVFQQAYCALFGQKLKISVLGRFGPTLQKCHIVNSKLNPKRIFLQERWFPSAHVPQRRLSLCRFFNPHHCDGLWSPSDFPKSCHGARLKISGSVETPKWKSGDVFFRWPIQLSNATGLIKIVVVTMKLAPIESSVQLTWKLCR